MSFHDLRSFLARLEREQQLARVGSEVDPHLETTALCLRALREEGPALLMERPRGSQHAYLGNLMGHRRRIEKCVCQYWCVGTYGATRRTDHRYPRVRWSDTDFPALRP